MSYTVKTASLGTYAGQLRGLSDVPVHEYVRQHSYLEPWNTGLLTIVAAAHDDLVAKVQKLTRTVHHNDDRLSYFNMGVLGESARSLDDAIFQYDQAEDTSSNRMGTISAEELKKGLQRADNSIGEVERPLTPDLPMTRTGRDGQQIDPIAGDAAVHLHGAPVNKVPDDPLKVVSDKIDWSSPASWINKAIEGFFGVNLMKEVTEVFAGDWRAWGRCADLWHRVGMTYEKVAHEVWRGNGRMDPDWSGNAADEAFNYFHQLSFAIKDIRTPMFKLSRAYEAAAIHANTYASIIGDLLKQLGDDAITAGLVYAGAGAVAVPAAVARKIAFTIKTIEQIIMSLRTLFASTSNLITGVVLTLTDIENTLPRPYSNSVRGRGN